MTDQENSSTSGVLLSFIVGGLAGAALAVLFAPRAGRETREILADRVKDGLARGCDLKDEVVSRSQQLRDAAIGTCATGASFDFGNGKEVTRMARRRGVV
jgi:gas vesicle protein